MNPTTIINALGGARTTARLARCSTQAVYAWQRRGEIPARSLRMLELARPRVFRELNASEAERAKQSAALREKQP